MKLGQILAFIKSQDDGVFPHGMANIKRFSAIESLSVDDVKKIEWYLKVTPTTEERAVGLSTSFALIAAKTFGSLRCLILSIIKTFRTQTFRTQELLFANVTGSTLRLNWKMQRLPCLA